MVVNASGPWTDLTNKAMGQPTHLMGGTKGSHIVVRNPELFHACGGREIFFENDDGRIVLIQPIKGRVMIGTTDLDADPRESAQCTEEEIDYFFDLVSNVFPAITVDRSQIVFQFSGIRPLPRHDDTQAGFVSRDYNIVSSAVSGSTPVPVLSLVGGKWTTFRALGERLADAVLLHLNMPRTVTTKQLAIGGGAGFPTTQVARVAWVEGHRGTISAARADQLLGRYGTRAHALIAATTGAADAALANDPAFSVGEVVYLVRAEHVVHLIDVVLRRTNHAFTGSVTLDLLEELARIMAGELAWDDVRIKTEVSETVAELLNRNGLQLVRGTVPRA